VRPPGGHDRLPRDVARRAGAGAPACTLASKWPQSFGRCAPAAGARGGEDEGALTSTAGAHRSFQRDAGAEAGDDRTSPSTAGRAPTKCSGAAKELSYSTTTPTGGFCGHARGFAKGGERNAGAGGSWWRTA